jgi:hypothetical protein
MHYFLLNILPFFSPVLNKTGVGGQILVKIQNIKFHVNHSRRSCALASANTDGQETNRRFRNCFAKAPKRAVLSSWGSGINTTVPCKIL